MVETEEVLAMRVVLQLVVCLCFGLLMVPLFYLVIAIMAGIMFGSLVIIGLIDESSFERWTFGSYSVANISAVLLSLIVSYWPLRWMWRKLSS